MPVKALMMMALIADQIEENGDWSSERSVKTVAIAPGTPVFNAFAGDDSADPPLAAWTIDINSFTLQWTAPATGGSPITSYQIEVRPAVDGEVNSFTEDVDGETEDRAGNSRISNLPGNRTWFTHTGLTADTGYYYRIRALNDADGDGRPGEDGEVSDWSGASLTATTLVASLGTHVAPESVTATPATDTGLTHRIVVTWPAPLVPADAEDLSPVIRYEIQWQQNDDPEDDVPGWADAETLVPTPPTNRTFDHDNREGDKRYVYQVRAINSAGPSPWSTIGTATTASRAPGDITLTATAVGATEILLQWNMPEDNGSGFDGYQIQRWDPTATDGAGAWSASITITGADTTVYTDRGHDDNADGDVVDTGDVPLAAGTTYSYRIRANNGTPDHDDFSSPGTIADATASAITAAGAPGKPTLTAAAGDDVGSITLTIGATSGATSLMLQRYENGAWKIITPAPAADADTHTDTGLTPGVKYYYALRASNSSGTGPWSDVDDAIATAGNPDPPVLRVTDTDESSVSLAWNVPANNGTTITGYALQRRNTGNTAWEGITEYAATDTVTQFIDAGRMSGVTYSYRIRALPQADTDTPPDNNDDEGWSAEDDADGDNPPKGSVSATTDADVPEAPVMSQSPTSTASTITITWTAPTMTGGSAITGYEVHKWNGSSWALNATLGDVETYTDTNLAAGTKHYYIVRAVNDQGAGKWSRFVADDTSPAAPDAPTLTATTRDTNSIQLTLDSGSAQWHDRLRGAEWWLRAPEMGWRLV